MSFFNTTLRKASLLASALLLCNASFAEPTVYHFGILGGTVKQTPAEINLASPVTADLSGDFYVIVDEGSVNITDAMLTTVPDLWFELPTVTASFNGFDISAPADAVTFDNGYTGTFDGNTLSIKGSRDSRPVDGPLVEYEFTAAVVLDDVVTTTGGGEPMPQDFFIALPDFRKCASPKCGGFFVKQVNKHKTECADGRYRAACYVAKIESTTPATVRVEQMHKPLLLQGRIAKGKNFKKRQLGIFKARKAYIATNDKVMRGANIMRNDDTFAGIVNNGIVCITTPCFSYDAYKLNSEKSRAISGLNLDKANASPKQLDAAYNILANGDMLFVSGDAKKVKEFAGTGVTAVVHNIYLPLPKPEPNLCIKGYEYQNGQCVTPYGCIAPQLELTGYGGAAMIDPVTGEQTSNISKSCVDSCDSPAELTGPGQCAVYYP